MMIWPYSFEQMRMAYLKTKAGPAEKVAMVLTLLIVLSVVLPLVLAFDINAIFTKIIGTFFAIIVYALIHGKIRKPVFRHYYKKNLETMVRDHRQ